jgi:hypothetical protein
MPALSRRTGRRDRACRAGVVQASRRKPRNAARRSEEHGGRLQGPGRAFAGDGRLLTPSEAGHLFADVGVGASI